METLLLISLPMFATATILRLYLHLVGIRHIYVAGHIVRHLFLGVLIVIIAGFVLAFEPAPQWLAISTRIGLGIGSALVLDEIVFLVTTPATKKDYVSDISLGGSIAFISLATIFLLILHLLIR